MKIIKNEAYCDEDKCFVCKKDRGYIYEDAYIPPLKMYIISHVKQKLTEKDINEEYLELDSAGLDRLFKEYEKILREEYVKYEESLEDIEE